MGLRSHLVFLVSLVAVLTLVAGLFPGLSLSPALANDTAVGGVGGDVYPLDNTDIRMEAETVQVICCRSFAEYRIDFRFVNEGAPQTVKLGFPFRITESGDYGRAAVAFRARQDGRPLEITIGQGVSGDDLMDTPEPPPLAYYLHEAAFPHGETMITVSYFALPTVSAGSRFQEAAPKEFTAAGIGGWAAWYIYWLHTGAGWTDTIGKSVVRFRLADSFKGWGVDIRAADKRPDFWGDPTTSPESYVKLDDRTYQWVYEDLEPTEENDVLLAFTRPNLWAVPGQIVPAPYGALAGAAGASGSLGADDGFTAGWRAFDGSPETAWGIAGPAIGGWLRADIYGNQNLREIRIIPGRNGSLSSFEEYGRPKTVKVTLSDGTSTVIALADEPSLQKFAVSGTAEWVRFDILDTYPGTESNDTYISEIDFGNVPAPEFDSFSNVIAERTPPTTNPPFPSQSSSTSISSTTTLSVASITTTGGSATSTTTTGGSATTIAEGEDESGRLLWPAFVGFGVAFVALGVVIFLAVRLRRSGRSTGA